MLKYMFIFILMISAVSGFTEVQYSTDNSTWEIIDNTNDDKINIEELNNGIDENSEFYFRLRNVYENGNSTWVYINQISKIGGEIPMSSIAIIGFVTLISLGVLFAPRFIGQISKTDWINTTFSGLFVILGIFLLTLVTAMVATVSEKFAMGVTTEIFRFMWILQWVGYFTMFFIVLYYGKKVLDQWGMQKEERREAVDLGL